MYEDHAHDFLVTFDEDVGNLYCPEFLTYDMHELVHLTEDAKRLGSLDNISVFPFENF